MSGLSAHATPELAALGSLERLQRRRLEGKPCVSVLTGPLGLGMGLWRQWLQGHRRATAQSSEADLATAVAEWQNHVVQHWDLPWQAYRWLAEHVGMDTHDMQDKLRRKTPAERKLYLEHALASWPDGAVTQLAEWLLLQPPGRLHTLPWDHIFTLVEATPVDRLRAMAGLLPPDMVPGLLLVPLQKLDTPVTWLETAAATTTALVRDVPTLPLAIAVEAADWFAFLSGTDESHARAILREGVVRFQGLSADACKEYLTHALPQLPVEERQKLESPLRSMLERGASVELLQAYAEAVEEAVTATVPELREDGTSAARSKAEWFLHLQLEAAPATAGLFDLNQPLGFRFGKREAEGDLTAVALRLVIEIDGHWHFQDTSVYRRDRRKDQLLQQHGWYVLRFLAEDVVFRLEEVLTAIEDSVAWRRAQRKETAP